jgi:hypothetical protein
VRVVCVSCVCGDACAVVWRVTYGEWCVAGVGCSSKRLNIRSDKRDASATIEKTKLALAPKTKFAAIARCAPRPTHTHTTSSVHAYAYASTWLCNAMI